MMLNLGRFGTKILKSVERRKGTIGMVDNSLNDSIVSAVNYESRSFISCP